MELPNELVRQHDEAVARTAEREQWAYAVAYVLAARRRYRGLGRGLDRAATNMAHSTFSTDQLRLQAASYARRGDKFSASACVRAVAKRIIKGDN